jgi:hypothetical protein
VQSQANLLEIVGALGPPRRFSGGLNCRKQEGNQDTNDGDHYQQFHQREPASWPPYGRMIQVTRHE